VKDARIEYARNDPTNQHSALTNPQLLEWYENRSEGIEQGFTLNEPPTLDQTSLENPLRLIISVAGDLQAHTSLGGESVELSRASEDILTYGHLVATDATGRKLDARMATSEAGDEIQLVVDDSSARYPIVIDPITASIEKKLEAEGFQQQDARFGFSVAID